MERNAAARSRAADRSVEQHAKTRPCAPLKSNWIAPDVRASVSF